MFDTSMIKEDTTMFIKTCFEYMTRKFHVFLVVSFRGPEYRSQYSNWLGDEHSEHRIQISVRLSAPIQTGPAAQPSSCTMSNGSLSQV